MVRFCAKRHTQRTFAIARHQLRVDVRLLAERARQVDVDRLPEVQYRVGYL